MSDRRIKGYGMFFLLDEIQYKVYISIEDKVVERLRGLFIFLFFDESY